MSNAVRGGAGGRKAHGVVIERTARVAVEKAMGPMGSQIVVPSSTATAERGGPIDPVRAMTRPSLRQAETAHGGDDSNAFSTNAISMGAPTPAPGESGKASAVPTAPKKLLNAEQARGAGTDSTGEASARSSAEFARTGGAIPVNAAKRIKQPKLPAPEAMHGILQGGRQPRSQT